MNDYDSTNDNTNDDNNNNNRPHERAREARLAHAAPRTPPPRAAGIRVFEY